MLVIVIQLCKVLYDVDLLSCAMLWEMEALVCAMSIAGGVLRALFMLGVSTVLPIFLHLWRSFHFEP